MIGYAEADRLSHLFKLAFQLREHVAEKAALRCFPRDAADLFGRLVQDRDITPGIHADQHRGHRIDDVLEIEPHSRHFFLGAFLLGDIDRHAQHGGFVQSRFDEGDLDGLHGAGVAGVVGEGLLGDEFGSATFDHFQVIGQHPFDLLAHPVNDAMGTIDQFLDGQAIGVGRGAIGQQEMTVTILGEDHVRHQIDDAS